MHNIVYWEITRRIMAGAERYRRDLLPPCDWCGRDDYPDETGHCKACGARPVWWPKDEGAFVWRVRVAWEEYLANGAKTKVVVCI